MKKTGTKYFLPLVAVTGEGYTQGIPLVRPRDPVDPMSFT